MKKICAVLVMILVIITAFPVSANKYTAFSYVGEDRVIIQANRLNVRTGPGKEYEVIGTVKKGDVIDIIGMLDNWYVVHLPDNRVGVLSKNYTRVYDQQGSLAQEESDEDKILVFNVQEDTESETMIQWINEKRKSEDLPELQQNEDLMRAALLKAQDMKEQKYLDHFSPQYGTPYQMLKNLGIDYQYLGENIGADENIQKVYYLVMQSPAHKAQVMSKAYQKIGVGIVDDEKYGKIVVQLFTD